MRPLYHGCTLTLYPYNCFILTHNNTLLITIPKATFLRRMRLIYQHGKQSLRVLMGPYLSTWLPLRLLGGRSALEKSPHIPLIPLDQNDYSAPTSSAPAPPEAIFPTPDGRHIFRHGHLMTLPKGPRASLRQTLSSQRPPFLPWLLRPFT